MPRQPYPPFALQHTPPCNVAAPAAKAPARPLVTQWRVAAAILGVFLTLVGIGIASSLGGAPASAPPSSPPAAPAKATPPDNCR